MEIQAHVRRQTLAIEDVADQPAIAGSHDDGVVQELRILPVQSEVQQKAATWSSGTVACGGQSSSADSAAGTSRM